MFLTIHDMKAVGTTSNLPYTMLFSTKAGVQCFTEFVLPRQGVYLSSYWPTSRYRAEAIAVDSIISFRTVVRTLLLADIARCLPHKVTRTLVVVMTTATVTTTDTLAAGNIDTTDGHLTVAQAVF